MVANFSQWLKKLGLEKYETVFSENEIDLDSVIYLSDTDLKELGLAMGPRRKLAAAIKELSDSGVESPNQMPDEAPPKDELGERRQVTVLFADISGFTELSNQLNAEETHALLNRFFSLVDDAIERHGGTVDKHIGDAVMAVFGAPVAHTDDPERALHAAMDIHNSVAGIDPPIKVHVGVASGQVVASSTGSTVHAEYTVIGDSVNLAARLNDMAKSGETFVSASVQRAVGSRFMGLDLGEHKIKGLLEPVSIWRLDKISTGQTSKKDSFVGRARELKQFSATLASCLETGGGETIILRGEAGIGKTRLLEEFIGFAVGQGFSVHTGLVLDFGTAKGQDAIRALVRSLLAIPVDADEKKRLLAAQHTIENGLISEEQRVLLNDLLDLPQPPDLNGIYQAMDNEMRIQGKHEVVGEIVRVRSQLAPLLLRIEDVHWADGIILTHLAKLIRSITELRILLILTTRIAGDPLDQAWRAGIEGAALTTIDLGSLRLTEANDLAKKFDTLDDEIVTACVERCGGNPLFLEQLLRNADDLKEGGIPDTIQGIVQARIDVLPVYDKDAIQAASVLGQRFSCAALEALITNNNFDPVNLLQNALIRPTGIDYHFAHALIREGVYASMLGPRRKKLHHLAATWFFDNDAILHAEHLDKAEAPGAANAYLEAAKQESGTHRYERALNLVERALQLQCEPSTWFDLVCLQGDLFRDLGQPNQSIIAFKKALKAAAGETQICQASIGLAEGLRVGAKYRDGLRCLSDIQDAAKETKSALLLSRVHYLKGNLHFPLGEIDQCMAEHENALRFGAEADSTEAQARAYSGLGDAQYLRGKMLSAGQMFERCIVLARENNLTSIVSANLAMLGLASFYALQFNSSDELFKEALELSARIGNYRAEVIALSATGYTLYEQGKFEDALRNVKRAEIIAKKSGMTAFVAISQVHQARNYLAMGQQTIANELAERAWKLIFANHFEKFTGPWCLSIIALSAQELDRKNWAIEEGFRILSKESVSHNHLYFYRDMIEVGLERSDWELLQRSSDALRDYTLPEPLPWSDLCIERGQMLSKFYQGDESNETVAKLRSLRDKIEKVGSNLLLPGVNIALSKVRHKTN